jgi:hypothetical protein
MEPILIKLSMISKLTKMNLQIKENASKWIEVLIKNEINDHELSVMD